jgi:hypothetical protein
MKSTMGRFFFDTCNIAYRISISATYDHSTLKTSSPVRSTRYQGTVYRLFAAVHGIWTLATAAAVPPLLLNLGYSF